MEEKQSLCSACKQEVKNDDNFCSNCGNNLKEIVMPISVFSQVVLYFVAIFLPPFGFWPGFKTLKKKGPNAKKVGTITIVLTLISTILSLFMIFVLFSDYITTMNELLNEI